MKEDPFIDATSFFEQDHRKHRLHNPITKKTLEEKYRLLLPKELILNQSVLDLGSCLGAAGQWGLSLGASSYTGVEVQSKLANKSRKLLAYWQDQVKIIEQDVRSFLFSIEENSYDIVVMSGILHGFLDPQEIIFAAARASRSYVMIEANHPPAVRSGEIDYHSYILQYSKLGMNHQETQGQYLGLGACLSKPAMDLLFASQGFIKSEETLIPRASEATIAYTAQLGDDWYPMRFFERYQRGKTDAKLQILEEKVISQSEISHRWEHAKRHKEAAEYNKNTSIAPWTFDSYVADHFSEIAHKHIPDYEETIQASLDLIEESAFNDPKIIDVGCATGETLRQLQEAGYDSIYGLDHSPYMLEKIKLDEVELILSEIFPVSKGPFDAVIANWTIHFIEDRRNYLEYIFTSLSTSGFLILTEKTTMSPMLNKQYHQFRSNMGLTDEEIDKGEMQLKGVLNPKSVGWYMRILNEIGFDIVDIVRAKHGFVTFLAVKNSPVLLAGESDHE
jgi:SAM-dependent methyltransferase